MVLMFLNGEGDGESKKESSYVGKWKVFEIHRNSATLVHLLLFTGAFLRPAERIYLQQRPSGWQS